MAVLAFELPFDRRTPSRDYQGKIVPSSFADITRALRECFRGGSVYVVSFRFKAK